MTASPHSQQSLPEDTHASYEARLSPDVLFKYVDVLLKRMDYVMTYANSATRLMYAVDGVVIAAMAYLLKLNPGLIEHGAVVLLALLLAFMNYLNANFLRMQWAWYNVASKQIRVLMNHFPALQDYFRSFDEDKAYFEEFSSTPILSCVLKYRRSSKPVIHIPLIMAGVLLALAIFLTVSWFCGYFPESSLLYGSQCPY